MTSNGQDHLTTLPPKILTKILAEIPLSSFLSFTHTSKGLQNFVKTNAAQICNAAIWARFPIEALILKVIPKNGWLVISHRKVLANEASYEDMRNATSQRRHEQKFGFYYFWSKCPEFHLQLKLNQPGPLVLFFLEEGIMKLKKKKAAGCGFSGELYTSDFQAFLSRMNPVLVAKEGKAPPRRLRDVEMAWYYGIPDPERNTTLTESDDIYEESSDDEDSEDSYNGDYGG